MSQKAKVKMHISINYFNEKMRHHHVNTENIGKVLRTVPAT